MAGLVLSGGGTAGAYQAGVLFQLIKDGMQIDHIYGVSIGSVNSALLSFRGHEALYDYWVLKKWSFFDFFMPTWDGWFRRGGLCSSKPLLENLDSIMEDRIPEVPFTVSCVSLVSGNIISVSSDADYETLKRGIVASASIPVIAEPVDLKVDGAVRDNAMIRYALSKGHDEIVTISCAPMQIMPAGPKARWSVFDVAKRALFEMMPIEYFSEDIDETPSSKLRVYAPYKAQKMLNFSRKNLKTQFLLGMEDARRAPVLDFSGNSNLVMNMKRSKNAADTRGFDQ